MEKIDELEKCLKKAYFFDKMKEDLIFFIYSSIDPFLDNLRKEINNFKIKKNIKKKLEIEKDIEDSHFKIFLDINGVNFIEDVLKEEIACNFYLEYLCFDNLVFLEELEKNNFLNYHPDDLFVVDYCLDRGVNRLKSIKTDIKKYLKFENKKIPKEIEKNCPFVRDVLKLYLLKNQKNIK